jgi:hypothetical protein
MADTALRTPPEVVTELTHFFVLPRSESRGLVVAYERHTGQPIVPGPDSFALLNRVVGWHARLASDHSNRSRLSYSALMALVLEDERNGEAWIDPRAWIVYDQLRDAGQDRTPGLWPALSAVFRCQSHVLDTPLYVQLVISAVAFHSLAKPEVLADPVAWMTQHLKAPRGVLFVLRALGFPPTSTVALMPLIYGDGPHEATRLARVTRPAALFTAEVQS